MKNNENAKERKSLKEVVVENKGKIIAGVSIVAAGAVGIAIVKNHRCSAKFDYLEAKTDLGIMISDELLNKIEVTEDIIVNSGIIEQARATIMRKRDNLSGKLNRYVNMEQGTPDIDKLIEEVKAGIAGFDKMLDKCEELEFLYKDRTLAETLLED